MHHTTYNLLFFEIIIPLFEWKSELIKKLFPLSIAHTPVLINKSSINRIRHLRISFFNSLFIEFLIGDVDPHCPHLFTPTPEIAPSASFSSSSVIHVCKYFFFYFASKRVAATLTFCTGHLHGARPDAISQSHRVLGVGVVDVNVLRDKPL